MTDIYKKLDIPAPSADLENSIIAEALPKRKSFNFAGLAVIAACFVVIFNVTNIDQIQEMTLSSDELLYDIEFFEDEYGFIDDLQI